MEPLVIEGLHLDQLGFVRAGLADGLPLDALCAHESVDLATFEAAARAWDLRLLDALDEGDFELLNRYDQAMMDARANWERRIPPLDEELAEWIGFRRDFERSTNPMSFLEGLGLRAADMSRLQRHWDERAKADPKVRDRLLELLGKADLSMTGKPEPQPPRFLKDVEVPAAIKVALPFKKAEDDAIPPPPPLLSPMPKPRKPAPQVGKETEALGDLSAIIAALPFAKKAPGAPPIQVTAPPSPPVAPPPAAFAPPMPPPPVQAPPLYAPPPGAVPSPPAYVPAAPPPPAISTTALPHPSVNRAPAHLTSTAAPVASVRAPMPFAPGAPQSPMPPAISKPVAANPISTGTMYVPDSQTNAPPSAKPLPFQHQSKLTVEQHATLCAEIAEAPKMTDAILTRYQLSPADKAAEDAHWQERMNADSMLRATWMQTLIAARSRLKEGR
jgi:hypothetical protein